MERINQNNFGETQNLTEVQARFFKNINLWTSYDFERFKFRLSGEKYILSPNESAELQKISQLISGQKGFIKGAIKLYQKTLDPRFCGTVLGGSIKKTLTTNVSKTDINFINADLENTPFITRLDLVKVAEPGENPSFQIVEVEGDKTHAFGYATFPKLIRNIFSNEQNKLGIVEAFKTELESREIDLYEPVILFLNRSEAFYQKELTAFSKVAKDFGINLCVTTEGDVRLAQDKIVIGSTGVCGRILVNIPVLTPRGAYGTGINTKELLRLYTDQKIHVLIPPFRFLGSKGLLGIFKNSLKDSQLEELLEKTFSRETLDDLRPFVPETINVTKANKKKVLELLSKDSENWVIKEVSTSGMRGVSLPSTDREKRERMLEQIKTNPFNFIIQKKVEQEKKLFTFVEPEKLGEIKQSEMFMRISPFITRNGVCEVGLTAREAPSVHGATDSIQIPVIF